MPEFPATIKQINYLLGAKGARVSVTAKVGSAQRGQPVAILGENDILDEHPLDDGSVRFDVGKDKDLIGKVLRVQTFVSDVNKKTNLTVVNYKITGGIKPLTDKTQEFVEKEGGRIGHFFFINFQSEDV